MAVKATDVAARAGVSIATVSLVVNGKGRGRVSADTQDRVTRAVRELGYVVNPAARSLVTGTHGRVALLAHDLVNPFIAAIAAGVGDALGPEVQLLLAAGSTTTGPPDVQRVAAVGVDGLLVHLADLPVGAGGALPVVVLDEPEGPPGVSRVWFDTDVGATALGTHLARLGHRRVAYLDSARPRTSFTRRREVFTTAFGSHVQVSTCDLDLAASRSVVGAALAGWQADGVTAVVTATDVQAYGALAALAAAGVPVPEEFSVASFDDNAMSAITAPPLTTVAMDARELGRRSAGMLLEELRGAAAPGRSIALPSNLVVRGSTAAARKETP